MELKQQMHKELSSLKGDIERERKARQALEKEVTIRIRNIHSNVLSTFTFYKITDLRRRT